VSYRATGNYAFSNGAPAKLASRLVELSNVRWAVVSGDELSAALGELEKLKHPPAPAGRRATPGLAFAIGGTDVGEVGKSEVAYLKRLTPTIVGVIRWDVLMRDPKTGKIRLDPNKREGGWGRVSHDVEGALHRLWTARSRSTIDGLTRRAKSAPTAL
jgi:hypothetical protein